VLGREIEEVEADEREGDGNGRAIEEPAPLKGFRQSFIRHFRRYNEHRGSCAVTHVVTVLSSKAAGNRADNDSKEDTNISQHDSRMSPFVRQQLREGEGSQLGISGTLGSAILAPGSYPRLAILKTYETDKGHADNHRNVVLCGS
jgi:hypothetical protein